MTNRGADIKRSITVAAAQMTSSIDTAANLAAITRLATDAAAAGASYVQFPEYCTFYGSPARFAQAGESVPGPLTNLLGELARSLEITLHLGSVLEHSTQTNQFFNTSVVIGPTGELVATYRKVHLFDIDVPGEVAFKESDAIAAGETLVVADLGTLQLGLSICFDLRFPELYRHLAIEGANVLAVPAAFSAVTGPAHWSTLLRARAIENHVFVIAAARAGASNEGLATHGHSMIIDPWGTVLAESTTPGEDLLVATIDLDEVAQRRRQINVLGLRRSELYGGH